MHKFYFIERNLLDEVLFGPQISRTCFPRPPYAFLAIRSSPFLVEPVRPSKESFSLAVPGSGDVISSYRRARLHHHRAYPAHAAALKSDSRLAATYGGLHHRLSQRHEARHFQPSTVELNSRLFSTALASKAMLPKTKN